MLPVHGVNLGHGYVKYVAIDAQGCVLPPVVFPSLITPAQASVSGALTSITSVAWRQRDWWVGEDALRVEAPRSCLGQDRLDDPDFLPVLLREAQRQLGFDTNTARGYCVTGLPATWSQDAAKRRVLGEQLRAASDLYTRIWVIPEPLGIVYAAALDDDGVPCNLGLFDATVAVVDGGHLTVDLAVVSRLAPLAESLRTYQLGTARALGTIQAQLQAHFDREFVLHEVDAALRTGEVLVAGRTRSLPDHWDAPLIETGQVLLSRLVEALGSGAQFDAILIGGGFAHLPQLTTPLFERFPHAHIVDDPQLAVARGYARFGRFKARQEAQ